MFQKFILPALIFIAGSFAVLFGVVLSSVTSPPPDFLPHNKLPTALISPMLTKQTIYTENAIKYLVPKSKSAESTIGTQIVTAPINKFPEKIVSPTEFVADGKRYPLRKYTATSIPNDPSAQQWWVTQTGLPAAWTYGIGAGVKIAVIDTGFGLNHEELAERWSINSGEIGSTNSEAPSRLNCTDQHIVLDMSCNNIDNNHDGIVSNELGPTTKENPSWLNCTARKLTLDKSCNGLDNDGNGYPSDSKGWDFDAADFSVQAGEINPKATGAFHGTAVAGTAAATGNNGIGVAGVSWGAKILPIQVLGDDGIGDTLSVARGIRYAADNKADIINLSLGSSQEDPYLRQAIDYAIEKGSIVIAAAGNDSATSLSYPASYPEVIAIGASTASNTVASFSNSGPNLDIIAPGNDMLLPAWTATDPIRGYMPHLSGTSFATPYISGLLANARAQQPSATWGQLVNALYQTADHKAQTASAPRSDTTGFGFVRADAFMARLNTPFLQTMRYSFPTENANIMGAPAAEDCGLARYPTAAFYEIKNNYTLGYSISNLTAFLEAKLGATVTNKGYVCTGLPTDQATITHAIDPAREFSNFFNNK